MENYRNHTFEAECNLLSELASAPEYLPEIRKVLRAELFHNKNARQVWETLCHLFDTGADINPIILYGQAPDKNWYKDNILPILATQSGKTIREYAAAIRSGYESEKVYNLADKLRTAALRGTDTTEAREMITAYEDEAKASAPQVGRMRSALEAFNELCEELESGKGCVPTGFPSLDLATYGGFEDGNLVIIAARPSVGKTALALHLARTMAEAGKRVAFFSLEMTRPELIKRICIGTDCVRAIDFRRDKLNYPAIEAAGKIFNNLTLYIDDKSKRLEDIRAGMVLENSRRGLDIVFVDYLGLVRSSLDDRTPQYLKIGDITGQMKELAKELHIPVVLLCQLNREADKEGVEPRLHNLRDSGSIEQDADIVIILHQENESSSRIAALVEKNRHGRRDFRFDLEQNESHTRFWEIQPENE